MKTLLLRFGLLALFLFALVLTAAAQAPQLYGILTNTTTTMLSNVTNNFVIGGVTNQYGSPSSSTTVTASNLTQSVSEFDNVGLTFQFTGVVNTTNGNVTLRVSKSNDSNGTYEAVPLYNFVFATPTATTGAANYTWVTNLVCTGATTLAFNLENKTAGYITNLELEVNLKAVKTKVLIAPY